MQPQEHQPLLAGTSSAWPAHSSATAFSACPPAAATNSSSVTAFQTCALQQARGQAYSPAVQVSSRLGHGPLPPPASRYPSFECSLASHSTGHADLCATFSSMSLSSSGSGLTGCAPARRYDSCTSSGSADVLLSQRAPSSSGSSIDRGRQGFYPPLPAQQPDAQAGPQPPLSPQQQQQQQQQQQRVLRYPSIDAVTGSGVSISQASSGCIGPWGLHSSSMNSRAGSVSSTCSGGGSKYPTLPGPSGNPAGRTGSCLSDAATPAPLHPHILDSWDAGPCVPSPGSSSRQADVLSGRERSIGGESKAHARQACGLYPVLSGQEAAPEQLQPPPPPLQQQQQPLHTHEAAPWGHDLRVQLQQVSGLPAAGHPYVMVRMHLGGHTEHYRTEPQWSTQQAVYGEEEVFDLCNVPSSVTLECEVWDKSCLSEDSMLGRATWSLAEQLQAAAADDSGPAPVPAADADDTLSCDQDTTEGAAAAVCQVVRVLKHPTKLAKTAGQLRLKVVARASGQEGRPRMVGPVRFRQHLCPTVGMFTGHWATEETMAYSTYKLFLCHISSVFDGVVMRWNPDYDKAKMIFEPVLGMTPLVAVLKQQHSAMYATQTGTSRGGVLQSAGDFFRLFNWGIRGGEPRFFTYVLCSDSFRCSETGTNFGIDIVSKHAMHAGGAEEVLYAGEFCIMSCSASADGYKLVLDNNSGTYSPHRAKLPLLQQLFTSNFPGMAVEVLDWRDAKLEYYHSLCPSRATAAAAANASAAAAVAAAAAARGKGQQFVAG